MAVNFVAFCNAAKFTSAELDWKEISHYKSRFEKLSADDREYLRLIYKADEEAGRVIRDLEEEGARDIADTTMQLAIAQGSSDQSVADELSGANRNSDDDDGTLEEEEKPVTAQVRSSRGRVISAPRCLQGLSFKLKLYVLR